MPAQLGRSIDDHKSSPSDGVRLAGIVTAVAWGFLACRSHTSHTALLAAMLAAVAIAWLALGWAWRRVTLRHSREILLFALLFRSAAFFALPVMEDDYHRFLWDGYRFAVTGDPYAKPPQAHFSDDTIPPKFRGVLDRINHPDVPTIYGPLLQWAFRLSHGIAPAQLWPWKLILLAAEATTIVVLWAGLGARGRLLLAWCPLAIFETGFNAHPDALAIMLLVLSWRWSRKSLSVAAGLAAGLAVATKVFALLIIPFVLWRLGRRAWAAALGTIVLLYAPFWLRGSAADLAGLRAMAGEWEFNSSLFAIAKAVLPLDMARALCGLAFGVVWLALLRRWATSSDRSRAMVRGLPPGEWIYGAFLLLSATANPWYFLWLWPFVAARPSSIGLAALAAVSLAYVTGLNLGDGSLGSFEHPAWLRPLEFGLIGCAACWDARKQKTRPGTLPDGSASRQAW
ncbi:hypothetical protein [Opitutus terrae]|nr:hypothetical protein [Opitutus terrae]